jgi:hypothetical protein
VPTTDGRILIREETDESAQKVISARSDTACGETLTRIVCALPEVKAAYADANRAADASDGGARVGTIEPLGLDADTYSVGIGIHTDERFEALVWYEVDRATGLLSVTSYGSDVTVPAQGLREVERVCRR